MVLLAFGIALATVLSLRAEQHRRFLEQAKVEAEAQRKATSELLVAKAKTLEVLTLQQDKLQQETEQSRAKNAQEAADWEKLGRELRAKVALVDSHVTKSHSIYLQATLGSFPPNLGPEVAPPRSVSPCPHLVY